VSIVAKHFIIAPPLRGEPAAGDTLYSDRFRTAQWSVILSCAQTGEKRDAAERALAALCRIFWRPVFALICRRGHSTVDAQDLTQDFFVMLLKGNLLSLAKSPTVFFG